MAEDTFIAPVVQVFIERPANGGMYENVHLRQFAGRNFLVGTLAPQNPADPRAGLETWCALDHVQMLIKFPDLKSAQQYWEQVRREWRERESEKKLNG